MAAIWVTELTGCPLKAYYRLRGLPRLETTPPELLARMKRGAAIHRLSGFTERRARWPYPPLVGKVDGMMGDWVVEIKTVADDKLPEIERPFHHHLVQVNAYIAMLGAAGGVLVYAARGSGHKRSFRLRFSQEMWDWALSRAEMIYRAYIFDLPPSPEPSRFSCEACGYKYLCPAAEGLVWDLP